MESPKKIILIAGGTGFLGKALREQLSQKHEVRILTRDKTKCLGDFYFWNPVENKIDEKALDGVTHIINLCGSGVADKRWTKTRKKELLDSRIIPAQFLHSKIDLLPHLEQYISASGANCYDFTKQNEIYTEQDEFGKDYLSQLVKQWEETADIFKTNCLVTKIRIGFVLSEKGGSLSKLSKAIKMGFGSILGSGKQGIPWIHLEDLISLFDFVIEQKIDGTVHGVSANTTNKEITFAIAKKFNKRIFLPAVPAFVLKIILGELAVLVLEGVKISNEKIKKLGFRFKHENLEESLRY